MKQENIEKFNQLPLPVKLGLGIIGFIVVRNVASAVKKAVKGGGFGKDYKSQQEELEEEGVFPSYSDSVYLQFAETIYVEYWGEVFSDVEDVTPIFQKMNNEADVLKLIEAFGDRRVLFSNSKYGLGVILNRAFGNKGVAEINAILKKKGIKYQF